MNLQKLYESLPQAERDIFNFEKTYEELIVMNTYMEFIQEQCLENRMQFHEATLIFWKEHSDLFLVLALTNLSKRVINYKIENLRFFSYTEATEPILEYWKTLVDNFKGK